MKKVWWTLLLFCFYIPAASAQECESLHALPYGADNAVVINECWNQGRQVVLVDSPKVSEYILMAPLWIPKDSKGLGISSEVSAKLVPQPTAEFLNKGSYVSVINVYWAGRFTADGIRIDLTQMPMDYYGAYGITIWSTPHSKVQDVWIYGQKPDYNPLPSGGDWGGIAVIYSPKTKLLRNRLTDLSGVSRTIGGSVSNEGIRIVGSLGSVIRLNRIERVAIGVEVVNSTRSEFDSSYTTITDNTISGVSSSTNPYTPSSRGIKFEACGIGVKPLSYMSVERNAITQAGGHNGATGGTGIYLVNNVRNSTFRDNRVTGDLTLEFALLLREEWAGCKGITTGNVFSGNVLQGGASGWDVGWIIGEDMAADFVRSNTLVTGRIRQ